jgi:site-specific DNA recombinase
MKVAVYVRVSSEDQARHGYSLDAQRAACRARAEALGATEIVECADEGVSGSLLERPGLTALRQLVRNRSVDAVVIYDPDRLTRRLAHQLLLTDEIEKAGITLVFVNYEWENTPEGRLFYQLRGAVAEFEREKIRLRTTAGRLQKARSGRLPFALQPYGYRYEAGSQRLVVVEEEARVVRRIFTELATHQRGLNGIARALTLDGIPTRTGKPVWHRQVVRQIAQNPVYGGVYYANRRNFAGAGQNRFRPPGEKMWGRVRDRAEWIPVEVPALVEPATWAAAQEAMARRTAVWKQTRRSSYLLSGLLACADCGNTMTGRRSHNWGRPVRAYTCAKSTAGARRSGCRRLVRADALEQAVWQEVLRWLQYPDRLAEKLQPARDTGRLTAELDQVRRQLTKCAQGQDALLNLVETGLIAYTDAQARLVRLKQQEATLRGREARLLCALREAEEAWPSRQALEAEARRLLAQVEAGHMPFADQQAIVRQFVVGVVVGIDTLTIRAYVPPDTPRPESPVAGETLLP